MRVGPLVVSAAVVLFAVTSVAQGQTPKPHAPRKKAPTTTKAPAPPPPAPEPPPSDVTMRMRLVAGLQSSENVSYSKGARQRLEFPGLVSIAQCDLVRTVYVNDAARTYAVQAHVTPEKAPAPTSDQSAAAMSSMMPMASPTSPRTGVAVYVTTITDTGERKTSFGREARHIRTVTVKDASAATCLKGAEEVDVDSWYVDVPELVPCTSAPAQAAPPSSAACADRVERRTVGAADFGIPIGLVTTTTIGEGDRAETVTTSMEVTSLEVGRLAASLFEVPPDYTQVPRLVDLVPPGTLPDALLGTPANGTAGAVAKKGGVIRIGVLEPLHPSNDAIIGAEARRDLVARFDRGPVEAVAVGGDDTDSIKASAARLECDYVLYSEVVETKTKTPGKVGGLLHKASGGGAAESQEVTVAWKLFPPDAPDAPALAGTAKASSAGGFSVGSAVHLAAQAGSLYLNMTGMGGMTGMMGVPMSGLAGGHGGGFYDPRAQAIASIAQSLAGSSGGSDPQQALRVALSKAFDGEARDLSQKLAQKAGKK